MSAITGYKSGSMLHFERDGKLLSYDLSDNKFKKKLKRNGGEYKEIVNAAAFFRNLSVRDIADGFKQETYASLIRNVNDGYRYDTYGRKARNFARIFESLSKYVHLESYLLLEIPFTSHYVFTKPASIYSKEVLEFMKESRIQFDGNSWEKWYLKYPKLFTDVCTHIRKRWYLDLEVYRMFYSMVRSGNFEKFALLVDKQQKEPEFIDRWYQEKTIKETGYGCEYKTLFDYLVRCERTEACDFGHAITLYRDYLKMMREIERNKYISKLRETRDNVDVYTIGFKNFHKVEKYPKYLKVRHDIVQKNYNYWSDKVDDKVFSKCVVKGYEWAKGGYYMVVPRKSGDVRNEGTTLHHCVASYISRIMDGTTQIVFMRQDPNESLVTVEIRAGAIVQARGYNNRSVTDEEGEWLRSYAKAKNLSFRDVKRDETMPTPPVTALVKWDSYNATLLELGAMVKG